MAAVLAYVSNVGDILVMQIIQPPDELIRSSVDGYQISLVLRDEASRI